MAVPIDWPAAWHDVSRLALAYLLALPIGFYRERSEHSVGLRTFPLVAMASCGYVMLGMPAYMRSVEAESRIIQGLVAGIGFIGGGAILKGEGSVHGTATAASIWATGLIGAAVAQDRFTMAIALALLNLITLRVLAPIKMRLDRNDASSDAK